MSTSEPWGPGHVIAGKFQLIDQLGRGGMGSVWAANHLALNARVAVKIIDPAIATNQEALERFLREAQAAAALRSPHVVNTFDYGVDGGVPFIAMELLEGRTLAERIEKDGPLSIEETAIVLTQVSRAITKAHDAGIVHRDLKPDNIFLVTNDDEEVAKVLDFGIAKNTGGALGSSSQTRTGAVLGTPYYMSPEQAEGKGSVDHRTDLWSLAVIAFECATGKRPFESHALGDLILQICARPIRKPSSVLPSIPEPFDTFFIKGTQREPSQRYQSARELANALRIAAGLRASTGETSKIRAGEDIAAYLPSAAPAAAVTSGTPRFASTPGPLNGTTGGAAAVARSSARPPRNQTPLIIGATVVSIGLVAGIAAFLLRSKTPEEPHVAAPPALVTAAPQKAEPPVEPRAEPTAEPKAEPAETAAATAEPAPSVAPAEPPKPATVGAKKPTAPKTPPPPKKNDPAPVQPKPRPRMDFGF